MAASGDTVFSFDLDVCAALFDVMDRDGSGSLSLEEVLAAARDPEVRISETRCKEKKETLHTCHARGQEGWREGSRQNGDVG